MESVETAHCINLDAISNVDIRFHRLAIAMSSPLHYNADSIQFDFVAIGCRGGRQEEPFSHASFHAV